MKRLKTHAISGVFVFLLLGIFAVLSTVTVLFGANAYKSSSDRTASLNTERILSSYVRSMVRAADEADAVSAGYAEGFTVVPYDEAAAQEGEIITEYDDFTGETYTNVRRSAGEIECVTLKIYEDEYESIIDRIYVYEGELMERMYDASEPFEPALGISICPAEEMHAEISDGLLNVRIISRGEETLVSLYLRSGGQRR